MNALLPNILIVDDQSANLVALKKLLSVLQAKVLEARSGEEALTLCMEHDFALLLLDVRMPGMDGYEVLEILRGTGRNRHVPVLFLTAAQIEERHRLKGYEAGAVDFMQKPLDDRILLSKVGVFLRLYNQQRQLEQKNKQLEKEITERRRIEDVLRISEERFRSVAQSAADAIISANQDGLILSWNQGAVRLFGYREPEIINKPLTLLIPKRFLDDHLTAVRNVRTTGRFRRLDQIISLTALHRDGHEVPVEMSMAHWQSKGELFYSAIIRDVTDRKRAEEEIIKLSRQNQLILNSAGEGIYGLDQNGITTFVNPSAARMIGWAQEDLIGKSQHDILHHSYPDGRLYPQQDCPIFAAIKDGKSHHVLDEVFWRKDGSSFPVEYVSTPIIEHGQPVGAVVIFRDVSEHRLADKYRQVNEIRLKMLLELNQVVSTLSERNLCERALDVAVQVTQSAIGYLHIVNEDQESISLAAWNKTALEMCTAVHDSHYPISDAGLWADSFRLKQTVIHNDYPNEAHKKGYPEGHFPVSRHMSAPVFKDDRVFMIIGVGNKKEPYDSQDAQQLQLVAVEVQKFISRHRAENALAIAQKKAETASRAKSEFLATMSHEIRTPLNAMLGMAELLKETPLSESQQWHVKILTRSGEALLTLINDILDLSKIESGQLEFERTPFNLHQLIVELGEIFSFTAADKGIQFGFEVDDGVPKWIESDPMRIRQILLNLINNAIKFTEKGEVRIQVKTGSGDEVRFNISDTGTGIPEDKLEQIFAPFTQEDASITRKHGGSGLGLTISRRLAELLNGSISVQSEVGKGSVFSLNLPLVSVNAADNDQHRSGRIALHQPGSPSDLWSGLRILLAEDTVENQMVIKGYLGSTGCRIDVSENGTDAVEKFRQTVYDIVLMDIQMPEMDGFEATKAIRQLEQESLRPPTPIIALTAHAMKEEGEQIKAAGCNLHLTKPVRKKRLMEAIEQQIGPLPFKSRHLQGGLE
ncbi:MAG: response regulator [Magnetococcales bacterium]|nr:response regulator [Magnetococcales bacterium]